MKPSQLCFLDRYYQFAEKCNDDYQIMITAIKLTGCDRRPSVILRHLELIGVDSDYKDYYDDVIQKITDSTIDQARWNVQMQNRQQLTLF